MEIILTGSLGNISKPLAKDLVQKGHHVTVISSHQEREKEITALGAKAAIGSLKDADFLAATFTGADIAYTMVPPANYFDHRLNLLAYYLELGHNYARAIQQSGVKRVINLSSIGAHMEQGNGILQGTFQVESLLNGLPSEISVTHIRPTEFYYNLLPQVHSAKRNGYLASNIGEEVVNAWVSPLDIAGAISEEMTALLPEKRKVRYVASEELTYKELAGVLGEAIGNPALKWMALTDQQMEDGLIQAGMNPAIAADMAEMYAAINSGLLYEDYRMNKPETMGEVKAVDFAKDFAQAFSQL